MSVKDTAGRRNWDMARPNCSSEDTAEAFVEALKKAYPGLPGEAGLEDLANALYK